MCELEIFAVVKKVTPEAHAGIGGVADRDIDTIKVHVGKPRVRIETTFPYILIAHDLFTAPAILRNSGHGRALDQWTYLACESPGLPGFAEIYHPWGAISQVPRHSAFKYMGRFDEVAVGGKDHRGSPCLVARPCDALRTLSLANCEGIDFSPWA